MPTDADRIEATERALLSACRESDRIVSGDGRLSEQDAAALLGLSAGHLKNMRQEGKSPPSYRLGMNGCRISYSVRDLAIWIESRREEF